MLCDVLQLCLPFFPYPHQNPFSPLLWVWSFLFCSRSAATLGFHPQVLQLPFSIHSFLFFATSKQLFNNFFSSCIPSFLSCITLIQADELLRKSHISFCAHKWINIVFLIPKIFAIQAFHCLSFLNKKLLIHSSTVICSR